ncbi:hypothetical protein [Crateriforma conspicua]|uniref:Uncharacterized protein n=1 Tax=Crateriforma conspicua TaxID=2527996 RepID=A0A5C6FQG7_9PLAN|nr:hypothetical protein [Crateriforma conspicua]TWU64651.1 hypothetical protein V7x_01950 [Crateriforma conspicua]
MKSITKCGYIVSVVFLAHSFTSIWLTTSRANAANPDWRAQWIWQAAEGPSNTWVAFRKEFDLASVPDEAVANISTDTK